MDLERILIVFIRYPEAGCVKTRLAKSIGEKEAASFYRLFVELLLKRTDDMSSERLIFYTPANKRDKISSWLDDDSRLFPQRGDNLGQRMSNAFQFGFARGAHEIVIVGTDIPLLNKEVILAAFKKLENRQCVIGPSFDGGYYLLGLSHFDGTIFQNINWGTDKVLDQTLEAVKRLGLTYSLLEEHFDVDDIEDLVRFKLGLRRHRKAGSHELDLLSDRLDELSLNSK
ncbi:hypothetical protein ES704_03913 [subsurface metagenome]